MNKLSPDWYLESAQEFRCLNDECMEEYDEKIKDVVRNYFYCSMGTWRSPCGRSGSIQ